MVEATSAERGRKGRKGRGKYVRVAVFMYCILAMVSDYAPNLRRHVHVSRCPLDLSTRSWGHVFHHALFLRAPGVRNQEMPSMTLHYLQRCELFPNHVAGLP